MKIKKINDIVSMFDHPAIGKPDSGDEHVMALTVDKSSIGIDTMRGLVRIITKRIGDVNIAGYIDKSELWQVQSKDGINWEKLYPLKIKNIDKITAKLGEECGGSLLGLEDPDIWVDNHFQKHVYFTIAFLLDKKRGYRVYLGHAAGTSLDTLVATDPVLRPIENQNRGFKEVAISPITNNGSRINLTESNDGEYSVIASVRAESPESPWEFIKISLHPKFRGYKWCAEHVSPCSILPPNIIHHGNLLLGIISGREKSIMKNKKRIYKKFRPGLILFDPLTGDIPWVSEKPLFEDPEAKTITFASDFIPINPKEGLLYAHINDSFVRTYKINLDKIKAALPKILK